MSDTKKLVVIPMGGTRRAVRTFSSLLKRKDIEIPLAIIMPGYPDEEVYADEFAKIAQKNNVEICLRNL